MFKENRSLLESFVVDTKLFQQYIYTDDDRTEVVHKVSEEEEVVMMTVNSDGSVIWSDFLSKYFDHGFFCLRKNNQTGKDCWIYRSDIDVWTSDWGFARLTEAEIDMFIHFFKKVYGLYNLSLEEKVN